MGLLDDAERSLLETLAIFVDGWTVAAAAQVAGLDGDRALALSEALARHSLVQLDRAGPGPRLRMLETVRAFVAERLAARPDRAGIERRHAARYRALAEQADRPLRGADQGEWAERLEADAGNLAAAVRWHLANDAGHLPHLLRILVPFWELQDHLAEARAWVDQLLPTADTLDLHARAELLWTAAVTAHEVGDDPAALAARQRLGPLLDGIDDPFLHAVSTLVLASISAIDGDFDGALRGALSSLEELRGQDEPFWTAIAASTAGVGEMTQGRYDDAVRHLTEVRVQLGTLAIVRGRLDEARPLLAEGLDLSLAAHTTRNVTLCLAAFALLAFAEGDPERAALVAGAAEGLRRRAALVAGAAEGLRRRAALGVWPLLRRGEAALVDQIRLTLGADRFDEAFAAGTWLTQREAVAVVRDRCGAAAP